MNGNKSLNLRATLQGFTHLNSLLHPFGISNRDRRIGGASLKGYRMKDFQDASDRYAGSSRDRSRPPKLGRDHLTLLKPKACATSRLGAHFFLKPENLPLSDHRGRFRPRFAFV
jgi:hypothetical protein